VVCSCIFVFIWLSPSELHSFDPEIEHTYYRLTKQFSLLNLSTHRQSTYRALIVFHHLFLLFFFSFSFVDMDLASMNNQLSYGNYSSLQHVQQNNYEMQ